MSEKIRRIFLFIVFPSLFVAGFIWLAFWGDARNAEAENYKQQLENMYNDSFNDLVDNVGNLEVSLSKLMVINSPPQYILMLDDIWKYSGSTVELLNRIPAAHVDTYGVNQFIVRLGDYCRTLTKKLLSGAMLMQDDIQKLTELHNTCALLADELRQKQSQGTIPAEIVKGDGYYESNSQGKPAFMTDPEMQQQYPELIYDGPFSETTEKSEPRGLIGDEIDVNAARIKAMEFLGSHVSELTHIEDQAGKIPAFGFSGKNSDGKEFQIFITKLGGHCLWWLKTSYGGDDVIPAADVASQLSQSGRQYLAEHGYEGMVSTYAQYYSGVAVINYAATQEDVILYSDLIKVWIDIASGQVIGMDTRNYLFSHVHRDLAKPEISLEAARDKISSSLEIESSKLALIPVTINKEILCYEFKGHFQSEAFIVYINASTGAEEQIFKIIDTGNGQLVI